jgi:PAS domain S-box-containing protein
MLALIAIATAVIGMGGIYLLRSQQQNASAGLDARAIFMANMLSKNLSLPMWDMNLKSIQDQLDMVMSDPEIYSVALYEGEQEQPLAFKKRDGQAVDGIERETPVLYVRDPSEPPVELGRLRIVYTRTYMYQAVWKTRMEILAVILFLLAALSAATYILLRRMVQKPVGELLAMTHRIAEGDLEARTPVTSHDEIGLLSEKFNDMTDKLKQTMEGLSRSEQKYRSANETLEARIQERTEKLHDQVADMGKTRKAMLNILEDIELSKKEAEYTAQKIDAMSQAVNDALVMIDGQGKVLFWNQTAEKLFGYTAAEAMGKDIHEIAAPPEVSENARAAMNRFRATGQGDLLGVPVETTAINRAGMTFPVEVNLSPFQLDEKWFAVGTVRDITERKQAEEKASIFFNATDDGLMLLSLENGFVHGNSAAVEMLGFETLADFLRCGPAEISPEVQPDGRKSDEAAKEHIGTAMKSGTAYRFDWMHKRCDGSLLPCEVTLIPIKLPGAQLLASIRDITERKAMEQKIIAEGERLKNILDKAPINIAFSTKGRIHFANPLFAETFGAREGDPSPQLYVHPEERDALVERLKNDGIVKNFEIQMFDRQKNVRDMLITYLPINYEGEDGILGWLTDITERKQAERELKERMEDLERFSLLTINREEKMIQLKEEINSLLEQTGKEKKYKIVE